ncbi:hypothetical protein ACFFWD_01860 [Bradyrhizobium erythrophlei]|uniref:hypothetical protein n=1 Tax=Bradyrhizobium erythrophlei TaxID=1437360 RepID=UPI0035E78C79
MSAHLSALVPNSSSFVRPLAAIIYAENAYPDAAFKALVERCRGLGLSLAGVLQRRMSEGPTADVMSCWKI